MFMTKEYVSQNRVIVTRKEAKIIGQKRYFLNTKCRYGHISERFTSNGACLSCQYERTNTWYHKHGEDNRAKGRKYRELRRLDSNEKSRKWYYNNKFRSRLSSKKWAIENRERFLEVLRINAHKRRAKILIASGKFTLDDVARIRLSQKDMRAYCQGDLNGKGEIDHIIAISSGGSNWPRNLQLLCKSCNTSKGNSDPIDFARKLGKLI